MQCISIIIYCMCIYLLIFKDNVMIVYLSILQFIDSSDFIIKKKKKNFVIIMHTRTVIWMNAK